MRLDPEAFDSFRAADALGRPVTLKDADGYDDTIEAGAIHPITGWVAWLGCRQQNRSGWVDITYRLRIVAAGHPGVDWEPVTYNPYFGCDTKHLAWHGDAVLFIYEEKHRHYAAWAALDGQVRCVEAGDLFSVGTDWLTYMPSGREEFVGVYRLPGLDAGEPLSPEVARANGMLPDGFDDRVRMQREHEVKFRQYMESLGKS